MAKNIGELPAATSCLSETKMNGKKEGNGILPRFENSRNVEMRDRSLPSHRTCFAQRFSRIRGELSIGSFSLCLVKLKALQMADDGAALLLSDPGTGTVVPNEIREVFGFEDRNRGLMEMQPAGVLYKNQHGNNKRKLLSLFGKQAFETTSHSHGIALGLAAEAFAPMPVDEPLIAFAPHLSGVVLCLNDKKAVGADQEMIDIALTVPQHEIVKQDVVSGQGPKRVRDTYLAAFTEKPTLPTLKTLGA